MNSSGGISQRPLGVHRRHLSLTKYKEQRTWSTHADVTGEGSTEISVRQQSGHVSQEAGEGRFVKRWAATFQLLLTLWKSDMAAHRAPAPFDPEVTT